MSDGLGSVDCATALAAQRKVVQMMASGNCVLGMSLNMGDPPEVARLCSLALSNAQFERKDPHEIWLVGRNCETNGRRRIKNPPQVRKPAPHQAVFVE
jgi:hypothetical protein